MSGTADLLFFQTWKRENTDRLKWKFNITFRLLQATYFGKVDKLKVLSLSECPVKWVENNRGGLGALTNVMFLLLHATTKVPSRGETVHHAIILAINPHKINWKDFCYRALGDSREVTPAKMQIKSHCSLFIQGKSGDLFCDVMESADDMQSSPCGCIDSHHW